MHKYVMSLVQNCLCLIYGGSRLEVVAVAAEANLCLPEYIHLSPFPVKNQKMLINGVRSARKMLVSVVVGKSPVS